MNHLAAYKNTNAMKWENKNLSDISPKMIKNQILNETED